MNLPNGKSVVERRFSVNGRWQWEAYDNQWVRNTLELIEVIGMWIAVVWLAKKPWRAGTASMRKETILILDKENHTRWVLKALLENEKFIVIAVDTIERALQNFSEFQVSGLITEYRIGRATTLDTVRELKSRAPEAYVMMLTADELTDKEYEQAISAGVDDYFVKPFPSSKILVHLGKGLKQRSVLLQKRRQEEELGRLKEKTESQAGKSPESPAADEAKDAEGEPTTDETPAVLNQ